MGGESYQRHRQIYTWALGCRHTDNTDRHPMRSAACVCVCVHTCVLTVFSSLFWLQMQIMAPFFYHLPKVYPGTQTSSQPWSFRKSVDKETREDFGMSTNSAQPCEPPPCGSLRNPRVALKRQVNGHLKEQLHQMGLEEHWVPHTGLGLSIVVLH